jgi:hypothetical protein
MRSWLRRRSSSSSIHAKINDFYDDKKEGETWGNKPLNYQSFPREFLRPRLYRSEIIGDLKSGKETAVLFRERRPSWPS